VGRAPILVEAKQLGQIGSDQKFGTLANHLRRQLKLKGSESLVRSPTTLKVDEFLYVNSSFAPGLDETVGNLYQVYLSILRGLMAVFQCSGGVNSELLHDTGVWITSFLTSYFGLQAFNNLKRGITD
jgi:hypothetical protein